MALKRGSRSLRFVNVANNDVEEAASSSTSSSDIDSKSGNKVRKRFSAKRLMKDSERYEFDYDHIYSAVGSGETNKKKETKLKSQEIDGKPVKTRCFSKNAIMARLNRERKKVYVSALENDNKSLREQNIEITKKIEIQNKTISAMKREIIYLKGLLSNGNELGQILRNLQNTTNLPITSSLIPNIGENCFVKPDKTKSENNFEGEKPGKRSTLIKFPMIYEDINLGSSANKSLSCCQTADFENSLIENEYSSYLPEFNESFMCAWEDPLSLGHESFYSDAGDSEVGICLHVNQKRISIEICSICNGKANSCLNKQHIGSKLHIS